jgi:Protein of unknown function (DUF3617)
MGDMKRILPVALALTLAAGIYWAVGAVSGDGYPYRKPGLWEVTNQSFSLPVTEKESGKALDIAKGLLTGTKICLDRDTDQLMLQAGQSLVKQLCSKTDKKVNGNTIIVETDCTVFGMHTTGKSTTTIRDTSFHTETESHIDGQAEPTRTSQDGRWIGACPSDLKPGDVVMMNGALKLNIKDITGTASQLLK